MLSNPLFFLVVGMSYLATISKKGLMTLPSEVRRRYGLKDGDKVRIIDRGGTLLIVPLTDMKTLYGLGAEYKERLLEAIEELEVEHDEEAKA